MVYWALSGRAFKRLGFLLVAGVLSKSRWKGRHPEVGDVWSMRCLIILQFNRL